MTTEYFFIGDMRFEGDEARQVGPRLQWVLVVETLYYLSEAKES
jgi:hypothetical protein